MRLSSYIKLNIRRTLEHSYGNLMVQDRDTKKSFNARASLAHLDMGRKTMWPANKWRIEKEKSWTEPDQGFVGHRNQFLDPIYGF